MTFGVLGSEAAEPSQVGTPSWIRWAGFAEILGGSMAVILTVPFASAYFPAYAIEGESPPRWLQSLEPELGSLLTSGLIQSRR